MSRNASGKATSVYGREFRYAAATVVILAAMLLVVGILTLQSWRTARTHERAVNAALRAHAGFASSLYRDRVQSLLGIGLMPLRSYAAGRPVANAAALPSARALHDSIQTIVKCDCRTVLAPNYVFRLDLQQSVFETAGDSAMSPRVQRWILGELPKHIATYQPQQTFHAVVGRLPEDGPRLVYFSLRRNAQGKVVAAYGLEPRRTSLDSMVFAMALDDMTLQRITLGDSVPNDSLLIVRAHHLSGDVLYDDARISRYVSRDTVYPQFGPFTLDVALTETAVQRLIVGGVPRSQLPLLLTVLLFTAGLIGGAALLTWRSWSLARLRADFTSSVSHELRTPITQILLFAETIALGRLRTVAECRREARVITEEGRRLLDLIENVLHFARSERYELPINRRLTNLTELVREAVSTFEPLATAAGITLRTSLEEDVGATVDGPAVQRSLRNVLDNAIKYAAAGASAHVGLVLMGSRASIWVDDRGPGIAPTDRARVWDAFVRLDRDMNQATGGSGIGLAVVRDIVVRHGGAVRVEDAPGGGARFVLEFPEACRLGPRAVQDTQPRDLRTRAAES
ncbi:MAG: HAMP domain-containing sensor histidine kinase [Gemmatimonadota bacterium]